MRIETRKRVQTNEAKSKRRRAEEEEEEKEFFNHYKNDLERRAHTPSGVAGADLKSQSGGALRTPTLSRFSPPMTCTIPLPNLDLPRAEEEEEDFFNHCV